MGHIHKILVPMDGSPCSIAGLAHAVMLAEDLGADLETLHVNAPDQFEVGSATPTAKTARAEAEREMESAIEAAKSRLGDRLLRRVEAGDPVRTILDVAANDGADLIVIGTHGRVGRLHSLVGSVAEGVMRNAPCPVLTVRSEAGEAESFAERIHRRESIAHQPRPSR
jgi:nucleotide-binding universal stress UspA family protein